MVNSPSTQLSCRDLRFAYEGGVRALDGVSLEVAPGELLCVIGPNGSGKSTLLRCLAGLLAPTSGAVELDGAAVAALRPRERARKLAFVPQHLAAVPDVRVEDFVLSSRYASIDRWRGPTPVDSEHVENALRLFDALDLRGRSLAALSGGQRQRVLIARAAAQSTPYVLVDEPTAALDPRNQVAVFGLLSRFREQGRAVIVATHELSLSSRAASRIAVLCDGRVRALGAPLEVLTPQILGEVYGPDLHIEARDGGVIVAPWARR